MSNFTPIKDQSVSVISPDMFRGRIIHRSSIDRKTPTFDDIKNSPDRGSISDVNNLLDMEIDKKYQDEVGHHVICIYAILFHIWYMCNSLYAYLFKSEKIVCFICLINLIIIFDLFLIQFLFMIISRSIIKI